MKYITESFIDFTPWHLYSCFRGDAACLGNGFRGGFPRRQKMEMKIKSRPATSSNLNLPSGLSTKQRIFSICSIFYWWWLSVKHPVGPRGNIVSNTVWWSWSFVEFPFAFIFQCSPIFKLTNWNCVHQQMSMNSLEYLQLQQKDGGNFQYFWFWHSTFKGSANFRQNQRLDFLTSFASWWIAVDWSICFLFLFWKDERFILLLSNKTTIWLRRSHVSCVGMRL